MQSVTNAGVSIEEQTDTEKFFNLLILHNIKESYLENINKQEM